MTSPEPSVPASGRPPGSGTPDVSRVDQPFDRDGLYALRATLAAHATRYGAPAALVDRLLIVGSELAANAVRHGGGRGRLRLSRRDARLHCQVIDNGPGFADTHLGYAVPAPMAAGGRGLWICRQLSDELVITNREPGATVTAILHLVGGQRREPGPDDAPRPGSAT